MIVVDAIAAEHSWIIPCVGLVQHARGGMLAESERACLGSKAALGGGRMGGGEGRGRRGRRREEGNAIICGVEGGRGGEGRGGWGGGV